MARETRWTAVWILAYLVVSSGTAAQAQRRAQPPSKPLADRLGCTHVNGKYNFTDQDFLNEGADRIRELGMRTIKLYLHDPRGHYPFNSDWPKKFNSLVEMASHPYYREVFNKPFRTYILTAFSISREDAMDRWRDGYTDEEYAEDVRQFEELATHLIRTYKGKNKTFILQNWEGDWALRGNFDRKPEADPTENAARQMVRWINARQEGVERARVQAGRSDVKVYHACEVNLVTVAMEGRRTVTNDVLPYARCDLYSYSAYDVIGAAADDPAKGSLALREALDYLASKAPDSEAFGAKNIYIGEFGWPSVVSEQDPHASPEKSLNVIRTTVETALDWGCPYIVYWQLYDNESRVKERPTNDQVRGFYLIKPDGEKALAWDYFYALLHPKR
ncbi:MAG TPA: hypothetical protein PL151_14120 [Phycisphaerae bacterium]|nr:hypothetical protein [Phycisphaerae bacterium]HOJ73479.1 hypothetical protein [Phycisphaerae bacterium]HOM51088.1 hypothetical protein [Phycisphaerae bacterium]HON68285.1 hypothetical protein [Phycisphaerae bacterium]HPP25684.1 hypothetical protein [Phycisphaerae bacterium]